MRYFTLRMGGIGRFKAYFVEYDTCTGAYMSLSCGRLGLNFIHEVANKSS